MAKVFVVDVAKCSGCYNCQFACKDEHCGNDFTPYAASQPLTGHFWLKLNEYVRGNQPKLKIHYMPMLCNHCDDPACVKACPNGSIYKREDGLVIINPETCSGCKVCVAACPYNAIYFNTESNIAQKCTGCAHLLDEGKRKVPRCVDVCASDALFFGDEEELKGKTEGAVVMSPETGLGPRVYYKNIPGEFIGGTVYDPDKEEVIEGAKCVLLSKEKTWETTTDDFGDFWFKDLPEGTFDLEITASGYEAIKMGGIDSKDSKGLGDLPMKKQ